MSQASRTPAASAAFWLPPKPQPPIGYDCCGGGCADCDLTRYYRELASWTKRAAALEAAAISRPADDPS